MEQRERVGKDGQPLSIDEGACGREEGKGGREGGREDGRGREEGRRVGVSCGGRGG